MPSGRSQTSLVHSIMANIVSEDPEIVDKHDSEARVEVIRKAAVEVLNKAGISLENVDRYIEIARERLLEVQLMKEGDTPEVARKIATEAMRRGGSPKGSA